MNIIVTGSVAYDEIMDFPGGFVDYFHPEKLHQINVSFVVDKLEKQLGGTATNISYNAQLAALYTRKPIALQILSSVGKDGKEFIDFFHKHSIDTKGIIVSKRLYTATGKVITDKNDNQIWGFYYGASKEAKNIPLKQYVSEKSLLVISASHSEAFLHFQNEAITNNIDYLYDPGMSLTWIKDSDLKKGVLNAKYVIGNDYEMAMITKRLQISTRQLVHNGISVITTLGEQGVRYEETVSKVYKVHKVKSYMVKKVIDPTGAGDAWRGGFVAGLASGMKLKDSLKLGNVMASFAIETYGTVNHKPTKNAIAKRMKSL